MGIWKKLFGGITAYTHADLTRPLGWGVYNETSSRTLSLSKHSTIHTSIISAIVHFEAPSLIPFPFCRHLLQSVLLLPESSWHDWTCVIHSDRRLEVRRQDGRTLDQAWNRVTHEPRHITVFIYSDFNTAADTDRYGNRTVFFSFVKLYTFKTHILTIVWEKNVCLFNI